MRHEIQERAYAFARAVVEYALARDASSAVHRELIRQLVKSATSVAANLEEAQGAESKADFVSKVAIARKEAFETRFWLRLQRDLTVAGPSVSSLFRESDELCRILSTILLKARQSPTRGTSQAGR